MCNDFFTRKTYNFQKSESGLTALTFLSSFLKKGTGFLSLKKNIFTHIFYPLAHRYINLTYIKLIEFLHFALWCHFILKMIWNSLRENPCKIVNLYRNTIKSYIYVNHFSVVVDINFLLNFIKDEIVLERFCRLHQVNKSCTFIFSYTAKFYWPLALMCEVALKKMWKI